MTQAGWYPDPAGQPQTFRYWDGTSWSQATTGDPYAPPPAPPAPPGYGAGTPAPPSGGSRSSGFTILLVVVAVLALIGLSVGGFLGYRAVTGDDEDGNDAGGSSETDTGTTDPTASSPTDPTESTESTGPTDTTTTDGTEVTAQQCRGGVPTPSVEPRPGAETISGGALTIPVPRGYTPDTTYAADFTWADDFTPLQKVIEEGQNLGWVSIYGVGGLRKANGFDDPAQAAEVVMTCMSQSTNLYRSFTGREDLSSGELSVDGNGAYQITAELRVDDPDLSVEGDVAQVIVVDMGNPEMFGLYITVVPIGDEKLVRQQEAMVDQITVD